MTGILYLTSTRAMGPDKYPEHDTPEAAMAAAIRSGCVYRAPNSTRAYCAADLTDPNADPVVTLDRQLGWPGEPGRPAYVYVEAVCRKHAPTHLRRIVQHRREAMADR